jgi:hypothetical protein
MNRPGCAGLWLIRQTDFMADADIRGFLAAALKEEATPPDLREMVSTYLMKCWGVVAFDFEATFGLNRSAR